MSIHELTGCLSDQQPSSMMVLWDEVALIPSQGVVYPCPRVTPAVLVGSNGLVGLISIPFYPEEYPNQGVECPGYDPRKGYKLPIMSKCMDTSMGNAHYPGDGCTDSPGMVTHAHNAHISAMDYDVDRHTLVTADHTGIMYSVSAYMLYYVSWFLINRYYLCMEIYTFTLPFRG